MELSPWQRSFVSLSSQFQVEIAIAWLHNTTAVRTPGLSCSSPVFQLFFQCESIISGARMTTIMSFDDRNGQQTQQ